MGIPLSRLTIKGFKSIRALEDFELRSLNVLIGPNGSGKSNFVSFFTFLQRLVEQSLQLYVAEHGGADRLFYLGPKVTRGITAALRLGAITYEFALLASADNRMIFKEEVAADLGRESTHECRSMAVGQGYAEATLKNGVDLLGELPGGRSIEWHVWSTVVDWVGYHFHDTTDSAAVRRSGTTRDYEHLRLDAANLAAFLLRLQSENQADYERIVSAIRLVAPFFDDFKLRPQASGNDTTVQLEWTQRGSDYPFHPSQLSDGTLRFACLATALLQPNPPSTILLDEPELGLHPHALAILADLVRQAATKTQVILCTQSASLVDYFEPEDIIVLDREKEATVFRRLDAKQLRKWLKKYTLGELWRKDFLQEGPSLG